MKEPHTIAIADNIAMVKPSNPWARISEVATRLGVAPHNGKTPTIIAIGADGNNYDVWEVVIAFLDRMEKT